MNLGNKSDRVKGALTAVADMFAMNLTMQTDAPYSVTGEGEKTLNWFGKDWTCESEVLESLVDVERELILLVIGIVGALNAVVIADAKEGRLQLFLVDRSKTGERPTLPKFWVREKLYERIIKGVKVTFEKSFYDKEWKLKEKGNAWMQKYLDAKRKNRSDNIQTYRGTERIA
jgi:hypothetical protein